MNVSRIAAMVIVIAAAALASALWLPAGLLLILPVLVAVGVTLRFRPVPTTAGVMAAWWTAGLYVALSLGWTLIAFAMGDLANDDDSCDALCFDNNSGLIWNAVLTLIFAMPMAVLGAFFGVLVAFFLRQPRRIPA